MIAINIRGNVFLCDMGPEIYDQIRLSVMAARESGFPPLEELADSFHIRVLYMLGVGPILQMGFDELAFLFAIMTHIATEEMRSYNSRVIRDILAILTCVLELAIETSPGT